jgi:hypothetical protein
MQKHFIAAPIAARAVARTSQNTLCSARLLAADLLSTPNTHQ